MLRGASPPLSCRTSPTPLITHRFPLEAYAGAYQVIRHCDGPRGKVMLDLGA